MMSQRTETNHEWATPGWLEGQLPHIVCHAYMSNWQRWPQSSLLTLTLSKTFNGILQTVGIVKDISHRWAQVSLNGPNKPENLASMVISYGIFVLTPWGPKSSEHTFPTGIHLHTATWTDFSFQIYPRRVSFICAFAPEKDQYAPLAGLDKDTE